MTQPVPAWAQSLETLHDQVWWCLTQAVRDRQAPARHPTLATVSPDGRPRARTVVLRAADRAIGVLDIHTHQQSPKVVDLVARPVAAVHVWDSALALQMRLEADAEIITGPRVAAAWAAVPEGSRAAYGAQVPGSAIDSPLAYSRQPSPEAFAVVRLHLVSMDILHLGPEHRRAAYQRGDGWVGQWLAP